MNERVLDPIWSLLQVLLGNFISSPGFIITAVILGVYIPGIIFSCIDVFITRRQTISECWAVYWRAMKLYSIIYIACMLVLAVVDIPVKLIVPATAPNVSDFCTDLLLYFIVGDFCSYWWHRLEHNNQWYGKHIHWVHHFDKPPLTIWTAMVVHPVEGLSVFVFFHIYGILTTIMGNLHPLTFAVAAYALTAVTMITHCGYSLPVYDLVFANSACHNFHHSNAISKPVNISVVFSLCDRLFGTYQAVDVMKKTK